MSDVGMIAQTIVATGMSSGISSQPVVQIKGGLTLGDLWKMLITMGYELQASSGSECAAAIHRDIQFSKEAHPLWTLSDILEDFEDTAQDKWAATWYDDKTCSVRLRVALQKSIRYLVDTGFLLSPKGGQGSLV